MRLTSKLLAATIGLVMWHTASAADVTLRFHQMLPPQATIPSKAILPWAQKVEKESGGRIKIQHFPSMQLGGKPPELYDQAKAAHYRLVVELRHYQELSYEEIAEELKIPLSDVKSHLFRARKILAEKLHAPD